MGFLWAILRIGITLHCVVKVLLRSFYWKVTHEGFITNLRVRHENTVLLNSLKLNSPTCSPRSRGPAPPSQALLIGRKFSPSPLLLQESLHLTPRPYEHLWICLVTCLRICSTDVKVRTILLTLKHWDRFNMISIAIITVIVWPARWAICYQRILQSSTFAFTFARMTLKVWRKLNG